MNFMSFLLSSLLLYFLRIFWKLPFFIISEMIENIILSIQFCKFSQSMSQSDVSYLHLIHYLKKKTSIVFLIIMDDKFIAFCIRGLSDTCLSIKAVKCYQTFVPLQ